MWSKLLGDRKCILNFYLNKLNQKLIFATVIANAIAIASNDRRYLV